MKEKHAICCSTCIKEIYFLFHVSSTNLFSYYFVIVKLYRKTKTNSYKMKLGILCKVTNTKFITQTSMDYMA